MSIIIIESVSDQLNEDTVHDKINQDRGCVVYPVNGNEAESLLMVLDGHGEQGDRVSEFVMRQVIYVSHIKIHKFLDRKTDFGSWFFVIVCVLVRLCVLLFCLRDVCSFSLLRVTHFVCFFVHYVLFAVNYHLLR